MLKWKGRGLRRSKCSRVKNRTSTRHGKPGGLRFEPLEKRVVLSTTPLITEFMAVNHATLQDFSGDYPDWIEIYNPTASPIDLGGWYLTDSDADLTRWQFPDQPVSVLDPGEYLVVFASSKYGDPGIPSDELHTNFSLNGSGEYLGLVMSDGATIADQYAPFYPEQLPDISYGAGGMTAIDESFIDVGAGAAILVPTDDSLGTTWTGGQPFDDSAWQQGQIGAGYDTEGGAPWLYSLIDVGLLGQRIESGAAGVGSSGNGVSLPTTELESETGDRFTITIDGVNAEGSSVGGLDWRDRGNGSDDSLVALGEDQVKNNDGVIRVTLGSLPEGAYNVTSYHTDASYNQSEAIRIFVTDSTGTNVEQAVTASANILAGGAGGLTTAEVVGTSATYTVVSDGAGDVVVLFDGTLASDTEVPLSGLRIERQGGVYQEMINTDLEADMFNQSGSAYLRIPFDVDDPGLFDALSLDINYDDGFVAYLNGVKIADRNAPAAPVFDSLATASHPDSQALIPETINVSAYLGDLVAGENILAIQGLNSSVTSSDFLIVPSLTGTRTLESPASYFTTPTPGAVNVPGTLGLVADTRFSVDRGFFDAPFTLEITTDTPEAEVRYTTDGSIPTATTGTLYTAPIDVSSTTVLRAAAFRPGYFSTNVDTQTYLFPDDVPQQGNNPVGYPSSWAGYEADYEMDPEIVNDPQYSGLMHDALTSISTLSIVTEIDNLFDPATGIYQHPMEEGSAWQRPASIELINPDGSPGFQVDAGLRIQGGMGRKTRIPKHSFRLKFTSDIGPSKLDYPFFGEDATDKFETITLRAGYNNSWVHWSGTQRNQAQFTRDEFIRQSLRAVDQVQSDGRFVQLYINGMYWGMYDAVERPDADFMASYFGGDADDYDALNGGTAVNGNTVAWNQLQSLIDQDLTNPTNYQAVVDQVDIDSLIDYALANIYGGNLDLKSNGNWYGGRERTPDGKWYFFAWDSERTLESVNQNTVSEGDGPMEVFKKLRANQEFRIRVADRAHLHFFNDGAWTSQNATARYEQLADTIDTAIIGESARWGDHRRDVNSITGGPYELYSRNDHWVPERDRILNDYLPNRSAIVVNQLISADLYSSVDAPVFSQHGGFVASGYDLTLSAPDGTIYYTLDGSDPREVGGALSSSAMLYTAVPIDITTAVTVRARALDSGEWSAINGADFIVAPPADATSLRITEINYNPHGANPVPGLGELDLDNDQFEFIELRNISVEAIDLAGVQFVEVVDGVDLEGIVFTFSQQTLQPGERTLVVRNQAAFESRYGTEHSVAGEFSGKLSNSGEQITLRSATGADIQSFEYNDSSQWPGRADGTGSTLEVIDTTGDYDSAANWRSSNEFGGSPAAEGTGPLRDVIVNEILSHSDGTALDFVELYNTTGSPIDIGGWYLSDNNSDLFTFQVPAGTSIGAEEYAVFNETQLGFALDGQNGDDLWLVAADSTTGRPLRFAQHLEFDATDSNVSLGRWFSGDAEGTLFPMTAQTLGRANSGPVFGDLLISEVHYNPAAVPSGEVGNIAQDELEFVELYNNSGTARDISNWNIRGFGFTFAEGTTVAAGEAVVVVRFDPTAEPIKDAAFRNVFETGGTARLFGPATGQFNNAGEIVQLMRPEDPVTLLTGKVLVDRVQYAPTSPWPVEADGGGKSLTRTQSGVFAPFAESWIASTPGPGSVAFVTVPADFNSDGNVDGVDRVIWEDGFGTASSAQVSDGDADEDGDVDGFDFLVWQRNYTGGGASSSTSSSTVAAEIVADRSLAAVDRGGTSVTAEQSRGQALSSYVGYSTAIFGPTAPVRLTTPVWSNRPQLSSHDAGTQRDVVRNELAVDAVMTRFYGPVASDRWGGWPRLG